MPENQSRRTFLKATSLGVAAAGLAATTPTLLAGSAEAGPERHPDGPTHDGQVVVYVRDHRTGEIAVMVGEHEVLHRDRALARRLAQIAYGAHTS